MPLTVLVSTAGWAGYVCRHEIIGGVRVIVFFRLRRKQHGPDTNC